MATKNRWRHKRCRLRQMIRKWRNKWRTTWIPKMRKHDDFSRILHLFFISLCLPPFFVNVFIHEEMMIPRGFFIFWIVPQTVYCWGSILEKKRAGHTHWPWLGSAPELCGWALWLGSVSQSCPPLVPVLETSEEIGYRWTNQSKNIEWKHHDPKEEKMKTEKVEKHIERKHHDPKEDKMKTKNTMNTYWKKTPWPI